MKKTATNYAICMIALALLLAVASSIDSAADEAARAEATKQEAIEHAKRQHVMKKKLARIPSDTRLQLAEAPK